MSFVMVPVPEEHRDELQQLVLQLTISRALNMWDLTTMRGLLEVLGPEARPLLTRLAEATRNVNSLAECEVADHLLAAELGLTADEVIQLVDRVNQVCLEHSWPQLVLMATESEDLPDGDRRVVRRFSIGGSPANLVLDVVNRSTDHIDDA